MPIPERRSLDLPGGRITYREAGDGLPLVFLHGINIHSGIWMNQFDHFANKYHVIAWDAPSYGGSAAREADVGVYAGALCELLDALGLDKVILVGHSMGGIIGGGFASQFPERLAALVLSCTHTGAAKPKGQPLLDRYQQRIDERAKYDPLDYGRLQAAKMTTDATPKELTEEIAVIVSETSGESFAANARMGQEADNRDGLARLTAPTLIVNGAGDRLGPSDGQKTLLATMPHAHQIVFEHCGHSPYLEDPAAYNEALETFFTKAQFG